MEPKARRSPLCRTESASSQPDWLALDSATAVPSAAAASTIPPYHTGAHTLGLNMSHASRTGIAAHGNGLLSQRVVSPSASPAFTPAPIELQMNRRFTGVAPSPRGTPRSIEEAPLISVPSWALRNPSDSDNASKSGGRGDLLRWIAYGFALASVCIYFGAPWLRAHSRPSASVYAGNYEVADSLATRFEELRLDSSSESVVASFASAPGGMAMEGSQAPCSSCGFRWPRPPPGSPTSSIFITGVPNHGAGVGHQFGEWVTAVWLAKIHNLTYVHTNLLLQSARWNAFLGLGAGEDTVEDLYGTYGAVGPVIKAEYPKDRKIKFNITEWTRDTVIRVRTEPELVALQAHVDPVKLTPAHRALAPGMPLPVLLQTQMIAVPEHKVVCEPSILRVLRQKYCAARIRQPVGQDLYAVDRQAGKLIITWHLRCGDSCFTPYRTTSFASIIKTSFKLVEVFSKAEPGRSIAFHFFSQAPPNGTAEAHFAPLMAALQPLDTTTHWTTKSTVVLHHLVTSDVLIGAMSGFSWLAFLHHNGVSLGTIPGCVDVVPYDKYTGILDEDLLVAAWLKYKDQQPKFNTYQDCLDMK